MKRICKLLPLSVTGFLLIVSTVYNSHGQHASAQSTTHTNTTPRHYQDGPSRRYHHSTTEETRYQITSLSPGTSHTRVTKRTMRHSMSTTTLSLPTKRTTTTLSLPTKRTTTTWHLLTRATTTWHLPTKRTTTPSSLPTKRTTTPSSLPTKRTTPKTSLTTLSNDENKFAPSYEDLMILCSHPPPIYSRAFLGDTWLYEPVANCSFNKGVLDAFPDTVYFCETLFRIIYGKDLTILKVFGNQTSYLYHDDRFRKLCEPLLQRKYGCYTNGLLTECDNSVVFLNSELCPRPPASYEDFEIHVANYVFDRDLHCLEKICDGTYSTFESEVDGLRFKVSNFNIQIDGRTCEVFPFSSFENQSSLYVYMNTQWPCCFQLHAVYWPEDPAERGLNASWNFLPFSCRFGEVCLMALVACVAVVGVTGNLMVVAVKWRTRRHNQESDFLRASLAVADFLIGVAVVVPSFWHHVKPLVVPVDLYRVFEVGSVPTDVIGRGTVDKTVQVNVPQFVQAVFFCSCSIASLMSLFLLSVERFVLTGRGLFYKQYVTPRRIRLALVMVWVTSCLNALLMTYLGKEVPTVIWFTFAKIPVGYSTFAHENYVGYAGYLLYLLLLSLSILSTALFSILSIRNFLHEQSLMMARYDQLEMRVSGPFGAENRYILITQLLMTTAFFVSIVPLALHFLSTNMFQLNRFSTFCSFCTEPLFRYFTWWAFLASTAWNPWIYNIRSKDFRRDLRITLKDWLPQNLGNMLGTRLVRRRQDDEDGSLMRTRRLLGRVGITI